MENVKTIQSAVADQQLIVIRSQFLALPSIVHLSEIFDGFCCEIGRNRARDYPRSPPVESPYHQAKAIEHAQVLANID
jgi:hypothetical protein